MDYHRTRRPGERVSSSPLPLWERCLSEAKAGEGLRPLVLWRPLTRLEFAALILATLSHKGRGEEGTRRLRRDDKAISPCSRHRLKTPRQNAFLRVQAIFGFVEHHRLRTVDHLVGDFVAAMRGQAMHEQRIGLRQ